MAIAKGKKRINVTVEAEPYERLRELTKLLGWKDNWLGPELDKLIAGVLIVAEQAKKDAESNMQLSEEQATKRYEDLMRATLERLK